MKSTLVLSIVLAIAMAYAFAGRSLESGEAVASPIAPSAARSESAPAPRRPRSATSVGSRVPEVVAAPAALERTGSALSVEVVDASGAPLEGAVCTVRRSSGIGAFDALVPSATTPRPTFAQGRTDPSGAYRVEVPDGPWTLRVERERLTPWEERDLRPGDHRRARLVPETILLAQVVDEGGAPVADARVSALVGRFHAPSSARGRATTNGTGIAELARLPRDVRFLHVSHPEFATSVHELGPADAGAPTVDVTLRRGVHVVGAVVDERGAPPSRASAVQFDSIEGLAASHSVQTEVDGRFASAHAFAPRSTLEVAARVEGYGEVRRELVLPDAGTVEVELVFEDLERAAIGQVLDGDGAPLAGVEVLVKPLESLPPETTVRIPSALALLAGHVPNLDAYDPKPSKVARLRRAGATDADGRFRVGGLHPRRAYNVVLASQEHANAALWIEEGEPGDVVDLGPTTMRGGGRVWGVVRRPDGSPIAGVRVYTVGHTQRTLEAGQEVRTRRPSAQRGLLQSIANADGLFSIEPLPETDFLLMCNGVQFGPFSTSGTAELGPLELVVEDRHRREREDRRTLSVRVLDEAGEPVPAAYGQLLRAGAEGAAFAYHDWTYDVGSTPGRLGLDALPGTYDLEVFDLHGEFEPRTLRVELPAPGDAVDVVLALRPEPPGRIEGSISDAYGEPLEGIEVALTLDTGDVSCDCWDVPTFTDASGAFSFGPILSGSHRLVARDPSGRRSSVELYPVEPGDPIRLTLD